MPLREIQLNSRLGQSLLQVFYNIQQPPPVAGATSVVDDKRLFEGRPAAAAAQLRARADNDNDNLLNGTHSIS